MKKPNVRFILNRPRNPSNIGAAARGMANFGFRDLAVVEPYAVAWREVRAAVHAHAVVEHAKKFPSLKAALKSSHVVIGTSAGSRRSTGPHWIGLEELHALVRESTQAQRSVALLFGSEKSGLSNEDLTFCHYVVRIPTSSECPSMNLAQAVAVVAYTLRPDQPKWESVEEKPATPVTKKPAPVEGVERLIAQGLEAFDRAGLLKGWDLARSEGRLRRAFYQWNLTKVDIAMLHGLFRWVLKNSKRKNLNS